MPTPKLHHHPNGLPSVQRKWVNVENLSFYKRSEVLYQLTVLFCNRFLPPYGDRTRDQMIQSARSTKQNIIEGLSDGQTSMETELKLLGIARGSVQELLGDYRDYLLAHRLPEWYRTANPRMQGLRAFCKTITATEEQLEVLSKMNDEELANMGTCLCHMVDYALTRFMETREQNFVEEGGIRERMTAARLEVRETQKETIRRLQQQITQLQQDIVRLQQENTCLQQQLSLLKS